MKRFIKLISSMMVIIMLLTCINFAVFAEDEDYGDIDLEYETTQTVKTTLPKGLMAHWKFDGDLNDSSSYKNHGKAIKPITYVDGVFGKAASFDGKTYIDIPDSDSLDLQDAFTVSLWVFKEDMRTSDRNGVAYMTKLPNTTDDYNAYAFWEYWYNQSYIELGDNDGSYTSFDGGVTDLQKWTLLTFTYDGEEVKMYHNDELATTTQYTKPIAASSGKLRIGEALFASQHHYYKGLMDDIKMYNYAFEYEEVEKAYNDGLKGSGKNLVSPPNKLVAYYNFDGDTKDSSGFKNDGVAKAKVGGITYVDGVVGKAVKLDGKSYIEVKDSNSLDVDKAFTMETWFYANPTLDTNEWKRPILNKYGSSKDGYSKAEISYKIEERSNSASLEVTNFAKESDYTEIRSHADSDILADGRWYHIAYTYDGKDLKYYLNGNLKETQEYTELIAHSTDTLRIGGTTKEFLKGMLDELKIYNYALVASDIKKEAARKDIVTLDAASKTALTKLKHGKSVVLKVTRKPIINPKTTIDCSLTSIVTSSNTKVLTVTKNVVKAVGKGTAKITIVNGTLSTVVTVTVK